MLNYLNSEVKKFVQEKEITSLYHFTNAENLESIFTCGLAPREYLDKQKIKAHYNDYYRYDGCLNAVSVSIEFPNYKMFYKLRQENSDINWAILKIESSVLYGYRCEYCWTNAGDSKMYSLPASSKSGKDALHALFEDKDGYPSREELKIPPNYPTNPQAEVLVYGIIKKEYIKKVIFNCENVANKYRQQVHSNIEVCVDKKFFSSREDYKFWLKEEI